MALKKRLPPTGSPTAASTPPSPARESAAGLKNTHHLKVELSGAKWGLEPGRQHFRELRKTAPKREAGTSASCDFGDGVGTFHQKHMLQKFTADLGKVSASHEEQMSP